MKLIDLPEKYIMDPVADPPPPSAISKYLPTLEGLVREMRITATAEMISCINTKARISETITATSKHLKPIYIRQSASVQTAAATEFAKRFRVTGYAEILVKENLLLRSRLLQMEKRLILLESSPKE